MVFQLEVYYNVDRLLTGLTAQQKGITTRWYSNKTSLHELIYSVAGFHCSWWLWWIFTLPLLHGDAYWWGCNRMDLGSRTSIKANWTKRSFRCKQIFVNRYRGVRAQSYENHSLRHPYSLVLFRNIYWWIYNILFRQKYFVAGGESNNKILDEVLMLTKDGKNWTKTTMKYARENHAVSIVPEDIKNYCQ